MILLEAQELRGVPVIKLVFDPQSEQFTPLGRALSTFVRLAEGNFDSFRKGDLIGLVWGDKPSEPEAVEEPKKPLAAYKDVQLYKDPVEKEEEKIVEATINEVEEVKAPEPEVTKVKKKKVETKLSSI